MSIRCLLWLVHICALWATACVHHGSAPPAQSQGESLATEICWSPTLRLTSVSMINSRLETPFEAPIEVVRIATGQAGDRRVMTNCTSYFALRSGNYEPESDGDTAAMKLEGGKCQAVQALRLARPPRQTSLEAFHLDNGALDQLPPSLGPESNPTDLQEREQATQAGKSWHAYDPLAHIGRVTSSQDAVVISGQLTTEVAILARADLDGDGVDDILVQTLSFGTEGSWREVRLRLLTRVGNHGVLRVTREFRL